MPTEACYVISIENAILLSVSYGILSVYFDDVMSYGYLFFAVFIGLCLCYVSIAVGFCLLLFDDNTSKQIVLYDSNRPSQLVPNSIPTVARILARSGAICSVALFIVFVTVGCEFFTDDTASEPDRLPTIALKRTETESHISTQLAVSAALAIAFMAVVMLLCNNKQLNSIVVRLQSANPQQPAMTSSAHDLALFVRTLLILYMIVCDSTGTFKPLPYKAMPAFLLGLIPSLKSSVLSLRNSTSLLFIGWCWFVDIARAVVPKTATILVILVELLDIPQIFGSVITFEALLQDITLTNFACIVLVACDAACIVYGSGYRIYHVVKKRVGSPRKQQVSSARNAPAFNPYTRTELNTGELNFNETDINVNTIRIFEKKSN
jgi:hypothetical protein